MNFIGKFIRSRKQLYSWFISFKKRNFIRNVATVAAGTAASQAIAMAFAPIVTRLYGPEAFGILGVFVSIVAIMTPWASLTYTTAIVLPAKDHDALGLLKLAIMIALCLSAILAFCLVIFKEPVVKLFQIESIASYMLLIPLVMFLSACQQGASQWLFRKNKFKTTAKISVIQTVILGITKISAGVMSPTAKVLVFLTTLASLFHSALLITAAKVSLLKTLKQARIENRFSCQYFCQLAKEYRDFPFFRAPQAMLNALSQNLPIIMLASLFGPSAAGFFAIGNRVLGMPSSLIGQSVGNVFYPRIAKAAQNGENLRSLIIRATLGLAAVAITPYGIVFAFGPQIFGFVFGDNWIKAGEYARWIGLWLFFLLVNRPCVHAIPVIGMQKEILLYEMVVVCSRVVALWAGFYYFKSDLAAIILYSLLGVLLNIVLIAWVISRSSKCTRWQA